MSRLRIGDLAARAGVTPRTIRYYEQLGLLQPAERAESGYRYYSEDDVGRLKKIDALKALGLSLEEVREVIGLYFEDPTGLKGKTRVLAILREHLAETETKIQALDRFGRDLQANIARIEQYLADARGE